MDNAPDPGSFGGHLPYSDAERKLGYGTAHDPRIGFAISSEQIKLDVITLREEGHDLIANRLEALLAAYENSL